jgi:hypothetical protein
VFADHLALEIDRAPSKHLDYLARQLWTAHANGTLTDEQAQSLAELLHDRQRVSRSDPPHKGEGKAHQAGRRSSIFPVRRYQRSPDRQRSLERRRTLAASGPMPPRLASMFTTGELAVLRLVADEVRTRGLCALTVPELAARAGVCRRTAQVAIRQAAALGLLTVQERRQQGRLNLSNILRIVSTEWLSWLKKTGCKKGDPTDTSSSLLTTARASLRTKWNAPAQHCPSLQPQRPSVRTRRRS